MMITVFVEIITGLIIGKDKRLKTVVKIAEMVRTVRILRVFRCLKFSLTLRVVVAKILSSARSLVWILILAFRY